MGQSTEKIHYDFQILVSYGYDVTESPAWYKEQWQRELGETKEDKENFKTTFEQ